MLNVQQTDDNEAIIISDKEEKSIRTVIVPDYRRTTIYLHGNVMD